MPSGRRHSVPRRGLDSGQVIDAAIVDGANHLLTAVHALRLMGSGLFDAHPRLIEAGSARGTADFTRGPAIAPDAGEGVSETGVRAFDALRGTAESLGQAREIDVTDVEARRARGTEQRTEIFHGAVAAIVHDDEGDRQFVLHGRPQRLDAVIARAVPDNGDDAPARRRQRHADRGR